MSCAFVATDTDFVVGDSDDDDDDDDRHDDRHNDRHDDALQNGSLRFVFCYRCVDAITTSISISLSIDVRCVRGYERVRRLRRRAALEQVTLLRPLFVIAR
jgi:hypothetical protein